MSPSDFSDHPGSILYPPFRIFRGPLFKKPVIGQVLFFCCFLQQTGSSYSFTYPNVFFLLFPKLPLIFHVVFECPQPNFSMFRTLDVWLTFCIINLQQAVERVLQQQFVSQNRFFVRIVDSWI